MSQTYADYLKEENAELRKEMFKLQNDLKLKEAELGAQIYDLKEIIKTRDKIIECLKNELSEYLL
ncbi:MAG: hypothetical protein FWC41_07675 [Firmicutes bacterium]|nr:hypothetical protein [Bacillota bacterium]